MPSKVVLDIPIFTGEDVEKDPSQLGSSTPYMLNWLLDDKQTAIRTRGGYIQIAKLARETVSGLEVPTLYAVYARDFGITGNLFFIVSGTTRDRLIAQAQHAFNDGTVFGSGSDSSSRKTLIFPAATPVGNWQAGADIGENQREQIDWRASIFAIHGRLVVFMPHQMPIHVYPDPSGSAAVRTLGIDAPVVKPVITTDSGDLTGDYKYLYVFRNTDELFLSESAASIPSDTATLSSNKAILTAANADDHMPAHSAISSVIVYRRKVSSTEEWRYYYRVASTTVAAIEAGTFEDNVADEVVLAQEIYNFSKSEFRGFGIAHAHGGRIYAGNQESWSGKIVVAADATYGTLSPAVGTASQSFYRDFLGRGRQILIRDASDAATYSYNILFSWRSGSNNLVNFAAEDRLSVKNYEGTDADGATSLDCRIPGDKRTIFAGYRTPGNASYRDVRYQIIPGKDADGELTGLTSLRNDLLACYQNALFLVAGGDFADSLNNDIVFPDWRWRYLTQRMGLIAPKTLSTDPVGRVYGFAGPAGGVWRTDGLSIQSISDADLSDRLNEFSEQKFATGFYDPIQNRYWILFPYSGDDHGFVFDFDNGGWAEVNHVDAFAPPQASITVEGIQPLDLAGTPAAEQPPIVDEPPTPDPTPPDGGTPPDYDPTPGGGGDTWKDWPPGES